MSRKDKDEPPNLTLVVTAADIDALYQRPLPEFTAARNELAKRAGKSDPAIKALEKPSVPAWAVNQLYWRERSLYDALISASDALRTAHRNLLAGKAADLPVAERAHRHARRAAVDRIRALMAEAGEAATPATLTAISETLSALPAQVTPGRLTRPLKPSGFEALTGVPARPPAADAPRAAAKPTLVRPAPDRATAAKHAAAARRAAETAAREAAREKERREAEVKKAKATLDRAQTAVARAETEVADCERALSEARRTRDRLQVDAQLALNEYQRAMRRARE